MTLNRPMASQRSGRKARGIGFAVSGPPDIWDLLLSLIAEPPPLHEEVTTHASDPVKPGIISLLRKSCQS
jgi:hypothetical protein